MPTKPQIDGLGITWRGADLPRVAPGDYGALCVGWQGPAWVRAYRRWSLRLEFDLLTGDGGVSMFLNLGNELAGPKIGRRSRFFTAWCLAHGEPPRRGQQMALETFTEPGLVFTVRIDNSRKDETGADKPAALVYSIVTDILRVERL